jgi:hypothetical protein
LVIGWIVALFVLVLEIFILWFIWVGTNKTWDKEKKIWYAAKGINLERLISDEKGDASLSRFQFLIFTFVIAMSLVLIIVSGKNGPAFPSPIPDQILGLLGISGISYVLAKGIQAGRDVNLPQGSERTESSDSAGMAPRVGQPEVHTTPPPVASHPVNIVIHPATGQPGTTVIDPATGQPGVTTATNPATDQGSDTVGSNLSL